MFDATSSTRGRVFFILSAMLCTSSVNYETIEIKIAKDASRSVSPNEDRIAQVRLLK